MGEVFDEELMKELGLDPKEFQKQKAEEAKKPPLKPEARKPIPEARPETRPPVPPRPAPPRAPTPPPPSPAAAATLKPEAARPPARPAAPPPVEEQALRMSQEIPVHLAAVLAKKSIKLKDLLELKPGEILDFKKVPQEPLDLVANGKLIAKAELVLVEGKIGVRIVKLIK